MTEIETIAKGLTKAQREALLAACRSANLDNYDAVIWPNRSRRSLVDKGLVSAAFVQTKSGRLLNAQAVTNKGLAVRDYLKQQEERDDG